MTISRYRERGFVYKEEETIAEEAARKKYLEEADKLFEQKNPKVKFSLDTNNETVIAAYNKVFNGFKVG